MAKNKNVKVMFTCTECLSDQEINPYTNQWIQSGHDQIVCKFCGGVAIYMEHPEHRDQIIAQWSRQRGIGSGDLRSDDWPKAE